MRAALGMAVHDVHKHFFARELRDIHGKAVWDSCFKFAFVRNPLDRLVSWWSMIDNGRDYIDPARPPNGFFGYVLEHARSFEEFILCYTDEIIDPDGRKQIFRSQTDYLVDENGAVIVDYIGRFERLQECFNEVSYLLGRTARRSAADQRFPSRRLYRILHVRHGGDRCQTLCARHRGVRLSVRSINLSEAESRRSSPGERSLRSVPCCPAPG